MTKHKLFERVRVLPADSHPIGVSAGMVGYIIADYGDGNFEIEFSDPETGETLLLAVLNGTALEGWPERLS